MKNYLTAALFIGLFSSFILAQDFNQKKLDQYFNTIEEKDRFMGSVAVSQNGEIIYTKSIGYADIENGIKADKNTKYRIGSISKTFTSVLVLKAIEEGKLELDQTIGKFFPSIENAKKITIRQLLNHRSGIFNFTNDESYLTYHIEPKTEKEMIEIIAKAGSVFEPDSKAEYSNSNFVLLTFILERTFKSSYSELLSKYIAQPIGLKNTSVGAEINVKNNEAKSYGYFSSWKEEPETNMSIPLGAGCVISTPSDLVKFSEALFAGKLVNKESLELMKTMKDNYGIGLFSYPFGDKIGFGHTGGIDSFRSNFSYFSDGEISYAMTTNGTNMEINNVSIAVLSAVFNEPYAIPNFEVYEVTSEELDQYLGVYSSAEMPLEITVTKKGNSLIAQGTNQPALPLEATDQHLFKFDQAGAVFEFNPSKDEMTLKQGGGEFLFVKQDDN